MEKRINLDQLSDYQKKYIQMLLYGAIVKLDILSPGEREQFTFDEMSNVTINFKEEK